MSEIGKNHNHQVEMNNSMEEETSTGSLSRADEIPTEDRMPARLAAKQRVGTRFYDSQDVLKEVADSLVVNWEDRLGLYWSQ